MATSRMPGRALGRAVVAALVTVTLATGCSDGDGSTQLRDEVAAQSEALDALRGRVGELEQALEEATSGSDAEEALGSLDERLTAIDERVADVVEQLEDLEAEVASEAAAREDGLAELRSGLAGLDSRLEDVEGGVSELRGTVQRLLEDLDLLRRRFETHLESHDGG